MDMNEFEMWARCHSRNVAIGEMDDTQLINTPLEEFVAKYLRAAKCDQGHGKLVEQLRSDGRYEIPVLRSKWDKMA